MNLAYRILGLAALATLAACSDDSTGGDGSTGAGESSTGTTASVDDSTGTSGSSSGEASTSGDSSTSTDSSSETTTSSSSSSSGSTDSTSSTGEGSSSSTGPQSDCGNGVIDGQEVCDSGDDNGPWERCIADCTLGVELDWQDIAVTPESSGFNDVVVDGAGFIYATGQQTPPGGTADLVVQQFEPDGTPGWSFTYDGEANDYDAGRGLALHPSGDLIIAGITEGLSHGDDVVVLRLPTDGDDATWIETYAGTGTTGQTDRGEHVIIDEDGSIVVAGLTDVDINDSDWLLLRYSAAGTLTQVVADFAPQLAPGVGGAAATADGYVLVGANPLVSRISAYDASFDLIETYEPDFAPGGVAVDSGGDLIVSGTGAYFAGPMVITRLSPSLDVVSQVEYEIPGDLQSLGGVLIAPEGDIFVAGGTSNAFGGGAALSTARASADLTPGWGYLDEGVSGRGTTALALQADGRVVVAGNRGAQSYLATLTQLE